MVTPSQEDGSEIFLRATFGLGLAVCTGLPRLCTICNPDLGRTWLDWVIRLGEELALYSPTRDDPSVWLSDIQRSLSSVIDGPEGRIETDVATWLSDIRNQLTIEACGDIDGQLADVNERAFGTACQLLANTKWAPSSAHRYWNEEVRQLSVERRPESGADCFYPSTDLRNHKIVLKTERGAIVKEFALLSRLTLHFQFVHEYVSHALPIFQSVSLSEEFLRVVLSDFYPLQGPQSELEAVLAETLDRVRPDESTRVRVCLRTVSQVIGPEAFSRLILQIAITPDEEMTDAKKRSLLSKLKRFTILDRNKRPKCQEIFDKSELSVADLEQLTSLLTV